MEKLACGSFPTEARFPLQDDFDSGIKKVMCSGPEKCISSCNLTIKGKIGQNVL